MRITIRYMAQLQRAAGVTEETVEVAGTPTLHELLSHLATRHAQDYQRLLFDAAGKIQPALLFFLDDEQIQTDSIGSFRDGAVLTILTPMAGGTL